MNHPADGLIDVWLCRNDHLEPALAERLAAEWLDGDERATAERFVFARDRRQHLVAHVLLRRLLALETGVPEADVVFRRSPRGRPYLHSEERARKSLAAAGPLDFNLSHADGCNAVALARGCRLGVDVEHLERAGGRGLAGIPETFSPGERRWLHGLAPGAERDRGTLRLWTLKESYSKARGLGLALPLDSFGFVPAEESGVLAFQPPDDDPSPRWWFTELEPEPGVLLALAVSTAGAPPSGVRLHHGFPWRPSGPVQRLPLGPPTPLLPAGLEIAAAQRPGTPVQAATGPGPSRGRQARRAQEQT